MTVCSRNAAEVDQSGLIYIVTEPRARADSEHRTAMCMKRAFFSGLMLLPIEEISMKIPKRLGNRAVTYPVVSQKTTPKVIKRKPMAAVSWGMSKPRNL